MATENINPTILTQPIANGTGALKNNIPSTNSGASGLASQALGFPETTMKSVVSEGGIPPDGKDFNGLFNLISGHNFFLQNGGQYTFNPDVSTVIGGYASGTVLYDYESKRFLQSLINNNTNNFVTDRTAIGVSWQYLDYDKANVSADNFNAAGKAAIIGWGMPDYDNQVSRSIDTTYTAPVDGFIYGSIVTKDGGGRTWITINATRIDYGNNSDDDYMYYGFCYIIPAGSTYSMSVWGNSGTNFYFVPVKGAL